MRVMFLAQANNGILWQGVQTQLIDYESDALPHCGTMPLNFFFFLKRNFYILKMTMSNIVPLIIVSLIRMLSLYQPTTPHAINNGT